jgi:hypothetical protein
MFKILRKKIQSLNQTQQTIITVILVLFNIAIVVFWINFFLSFEKVTPPLAEEKIGVEKQLKELERLRQEAGAQPLTDEEIQRQLKELEKLRPR